jgi:protein-S-isoprenylcysteine O-methyltransferase Ste14
MEIFLPAFFVISLLLVFAYRVHRVWRRTGINPIAFDRSDPLDAYVARMFLAIEAAIAMSIALYVAGEHAYGVLHPVTWMQVPWVQATGATLLVVSLLWALIAQSNMGSSWRVGVDREHRTELVTRGLFRISRNPIFLSMRVSLWGLFLCLPNMLTLLSLALGTALIQVQVRLEEKHLEASHGADYIAYRDRVRRWL